MCDGMKGTSLLTMSAKSKWEFFFPSFSVFFNLRVQFFFLPLSGKQKRKKKRKERKISILLLWRINSGILVQSEKFVLNWDIFHFFAIVESQRHTMLISNLLQKKISFLELKTQQMQSNVKPTTTKKLSSHHRLYRVVWFQSITTSNKQMKSPRETNLPQHKSL